LVGDDRIDLICSSGHRTAHSLSRIVRLNDGWCGKCGADISYTPLADADATRKGGEPSPPSPVLASVGAEI
jgi:hypothetical protein